MKEKYVGQKYEPPFEVIPDEPSAEPAATTNVVIDGPGEYVNREGQTVRIEGLTTDKDGLVQFPEHVWTDGEDTFRPDGTWGEVKGNIHLSDIVRKAVVPDRPKFKPGDKVRLRDFAYGTNVKASVSYGSTETIREVFKAQDNLDGKTQHLHVQHLGTGMSSLWFDLVEVWDPAKAPAPHGADTKPSNPKDVIGSTKPPLSCIPTGPLYEVGAAMLDGSAKYGRHNWRVIGVRSSVYYDAALRHLMKWWEGEELDADSGCHHLAHAVACCLIVRDAANLGQLTDDRPVPGGDPTAGVKELIKQIKERYPEPVPPFLASQK